MSVKSALQRFFRRNGTDAIAGEKRFLYGKSVTNQRIEAWWGILRRGCADWCIRFFKDMRDCGLYCDDNVVQADCLKFCFMPVIRHELHKVAVLWNLHKIRPSTIQESPRNRRVFYHNVIHGLGFFICFMIKILRTQNNKTRFFYVLHFDKTWVFDQSECAQNPIYT